MSLFINNTPCIFQNKQIKVISVDPCNKNINGNTVLINYTNVAKADSATNTANKVYYRGQLLCHCKSFFAKSSGDEDGDLLGLYSKTNCGKAEFITHSVNVFIEGNNAVRHGDLMVSNQRNSLPAPVMNLTQK